MPMEYPVPDPLDVEQLTNVSRVIDPDDDLVSIVSDEGSNTHFKLGPGTHLISNSVALSDNVVLEGYGMGSTVIKIEAGDSPGVAVEANGVNNVVTKNLTLDINGANLTNEPTEGTRGISHHGNGSKALTENVEVINATGHSVKWYNWDKGWARRVWSHTPVTDNAGSGAIQPGAAGYTTTSIFITECLMEEGGNMISPRGGPTRHVLIANNRIRYPQYSANANMISTSGTDTEYISVVGNVVDADGASGVVRCARIWDSSKVSIVGNVFTDSEGTGDVYAGVKTIGNAEYVTVGNNVIEGISQGGGVKLDSLGHCAVTGNVVRNTGTPAIEEMSGDDNLIANNIVDVPGTSISRSGANTLIYSNHPRFYDLNEVIAGIAGGGTALSSAIPNASLADDVEVHVIPDADPGNDVAFDGSVIWDDSAGALKVRVEELANAGGGDAHVYAKAVP